MSQKELQKTKNFINQIIENDLYNQKTHTKIKTRFPPEPNGFLHIGHAKSICLNFKLASNYGGTCNLRFDDTNPITENSEYVESIKEDVRWLGFGENEAIHYTSDYFEQLYGFACKLIKDEKAYVDTQTYEIIKSQRGTLTIPGIDSPFRNRTAIENLSLFEKMKNGEFQEGSHVLRAKIDMTSPNLNMRDPTLYRIRKVNHHRTGEKWCIYPTYDFSHCLSDAIEGVTHSICTLEFEDHRPLYDWVIDNSGVQKKPKQIEFSRLDLNYSITSKRKLLSLIKENHVEGWDDPRLPTIKGMRRRGYPPEAIVKFCDLIGVTKKQATIDFSQLENCVRENLDKNTPRTMVVAQPLKIIIENLEPSEEIVINAPNHPKDLSFGSRNLILKRELFIDKNDFMETPTKKYRRLSIGKEVRLRYGFVIRCSEVIKEGNEIKELRCEYIKDTLNGKNPPGKKVKGIIHWISAENSQSISLRAFERLFNNPNPAAKDSFTETLNEESIIIYPNALAEKDFINSSHKSFQFERMGYYVLDEQLSEKGKLVFNQTVGLRDTWNKN